MKGYITIHVPEHSHKICAGCDHFSHKLVKSGYDPIYKNDCIHPNAPNKGNIYGDHTPDWCPVGERRENE